MSKSTPWRVTVVQPRAGNGERSSLRLMPPEGRSSIVLLVHRGDVVASEPRVYPRAERAS